MIKHLYTTDLQHQSCIPESSSVSMHGIADYSRWYSHSWMQSTEWNVGKATGRTCIEWKYLLPSFGGKFWILSIFAIGKYASDKLGEAALLDNYIVNKHEPWKGRFKTLLARWTPNRYCLVSSRGYRTVLYFREYKNSVREDFYRHTSTRGYIFRLLKPICLSTFWPCLVCRNTRYPHLVVT